MEDLGQNPRQNEVCHTSPRLSLAPSIMGSHQGIFGRFLKNSAEDLQIYLYVNPSWSFSDCLGCTDFRICLNY